MKGGKGRRKNNLAVSIELEHGLVAVATHVYWWGCGVLNRGKYIVLRMPAISLRANTNVDTTFGILRANCQGTPPATISCSDLLPSLLAVDRAMSMLSR
jgi:hypothetical protein